MNKYFIVYEKWTRVMGRPIDSNNNVILEIDYNDLEIGKIENILKEKESSNCIKISIKSINKL